MRPDEASPSTKPGQLQQASLSSAAPLAAALFLATVGLVIARPWRLTEAGAALVGALAMVAAGLVSPNGAAADVMGHWNVLLFFLGLTGAAAVAERSGVFEALAGTSALLSRGSPPRLLVAVVVAGSIVAAVLSNDAAALVLTPVVYVLVARFGLSPLPYVLACTFVADAASIALPVSNPVNVIVSDRLGVSAAGLVPVLLPAAIASVAALLLCIFVIYRKQLPARAPLTPNASSWASWNGVPRRMLAAFALAAAAFAVASAANLPLGPTMAAAWLLILAVERTTSLHERPLEGVGWSLLVFVASMAVLVDGLSATGITAWLAQAMLGQVRDSPAAVMVVCAFSAAAASNLVNNLPAAFVFADAVHGAGLSPASTPCGRPRHDHRGGPGTQLDAGRISGHPPLVRAASPAWA